MKSVCASHPCASNSTLTCGENGCIKEPATALGEWAWPHRITPDLRIVNAITEDVYDPAEYEAYLEEERRMVIEAMEKRYRMRIEIQDDPRLHRATGSARYLSL